MNTTLQPARLRMADIGDAVRSGARMLRAAPRTSIAYAMVFALPGLVVLTVIGILGVSPLALPFAGGFMLLGPILLSGYFELAILWERGVQPAVRDAFGAFRRAPPGLWLLALICALLFLIWITDAGILYSVTLGGTHLPYDLAWLGDSRGDIIAFELWGALMGSGLAFMIFSISAFSVPLIHERRGGVVQAVSASVRMVFSNFLVCISWGITLGGVIMLSILLLPLLLLTLPLMSYASFALYRRAFPPIDTESDIAVPPIHRS